jgi:hypothetical protein
VETGRGRRLLGHRRRLAAGEAAAGWLQCCIVGLGTSGLGLILNCVAGLGTTGLGWAAPIDGSL